MKTYIKYAVIGLILILSVVSLMGCDGGVYIPPLVTSYTVYIESYDGVSGYLYVDGANVGYLYPYSSVSVTLSSGSHSVSLNGAFYGYITPSYNGEIFYVDSNYNIWY